MRLLFVKLKHIGDALLLTPTLAAVQAAYPAARLWVVVRHGTEGILAGCPQIERVLTAAPAERGRRAAFGWVADVRLLRELRRQRFDYAFELTHGDRGRFLAGASGARLRVASDGAYRVPRFWRGWFHRISPTDLRAEHQAQVGFRVVREFLPLAGTEAPPLVFERARTTRCALAGDAVPFTVVHPGTRWQRKRWALDRWLEVGRGLLARAPRLLISVGPDPEEVRLGNELAAGLGRAALCTQGQLAWTELADLLYRARLFVGVDTAAMHLAAACQCPTVALFGASVAQHWRPWRVPHRLVGAPAAADRAADPEGMRRIAPAEVLSACDELWVVRGG